MACRFPAARLTAAGLLAISLAACQTGEAPQSASRAAADPELTRQADAMQKTILEGALAGAATGGGIQILAGGDNDSVASGVSLGAFLGAAAGTYVALIQRSYATKERRLRAIKTDLDRNSAEIEATIAVMRNVLAVQEAELNAIRARAASGQADSAAVSAELAEAQANLAEMERAIDGATSRQSEFASARGLVPAPGGRSRIDPELAALSNQISEMRAIAGDLAQSL